MKVFGHPLSACTRKVLFTVTEKGAHADFVLVDLLEGAHRRADHLARQPFGRIPVLEDDGFVLYESRAICRYLDRQIEGPALTPPRPRDTARMEQWLSVDQSYVSPNTSALAHERVFKRHRGEEADAGVVARAEEALATAFAVHEQALASSPWLAGDTFSLADVSLLPYVEALELLGASRTLAGLPHLADWRTRASRRPGWPASLRLTGGP